MGVAGDRSPFVRLPLALAEPRRSNVDARRETAVKGKYLKGKTIEFDGSQVSPLWAYENLDVQGDSIISFRGPCSLEPDSMVDAEDRKRKSTISSTDMLHFIVEYFDCRLTEIVLIQRLLVQVVMDLLRELIYEEAEVERERDNIYGYPPDSDQRGKLSVSAATVSPVSGLIHLGLNIATEPAPVRTIGLEELGVEDIDEFAVEVAKRFIEEVKSIKRDASKMRPVY